MEKIRFVEYIKQQVEAGNVDAADTKHWYNDYAWYTGPEYKVKIRTKLFTRRKVVDLLRMRKGAGYYDWINYTLEEKQMLLDLLPEAIKVSDAKNAAREEQYRLEREALEWWP